MQNKIAVIHGPNLNLLGERETSIYGKTTLNSINDNLKQIAKKSYISLDIFQSNNEGDIVDFIQQCKDCNGIVINAAAYTHTSIAIRDALAAVKVPFIEVHLSNVHSREDFRKTSYLSDKAVGVICGLGEHSYYYALEFLINNMAAN